MIGESKRENTERGGGVVSEGEDQSDELPIQRERRSIRRQETPIIPKGKRLKRMANRRISVVSESDTSDTNYNRADDYVEKQSRGR